MDVILQIFTSVPESVWLAVGGAVGVSLIVQPLKRWLGLQSDKVVLFLTSTVAFAGVAVEYLLSAAAENPTILGQRTAVILGISQLAYRFLIKPSSNLLADAKAERERRTGEATPDPETAGAAPVSLYAGPNTEY